MYDMVIYLPSQECHKRMLTKVMDKKKNKEQTISEELDELLELKRNENSALKKIFESLKKNEKKKK